mmetsp:Transcript_85281/g.260735  ORF Transcript_85281/g.260735 Transcript_85281/m.260735 type:complete len:104 (+) Transcript_85281:1361-1672(+)
MDRRDDRIDATRGRPAVHVANLRWRSADSVWRQVPRIRSPARNADGSQRTKDSLLRLSSSTLALAPCAWWSGHGRLSADEALGGAPEGAPPAGWALHGEPGGD